MTRIAGQAWALTRRSVLATWRQPGSWIPGLFFPLMLAAVYAAQFQRATELPQFPTDSFLEFILPASILQGVSFGSTNGGTDLANDIDSGFFDRLVVTPVARVSILLGRIAGSAVFSAVQAAVLIAVFIAFGAEVAAGPAGIAAIVVVATVLAVGIGGFGLTFALRTGNAEATQSTFPLVFALVFVSSAFFPVELMSGWYRVMAERNPLTFVIDATRRLVLEGWSWTDLGEGLAVSAAIAVVSLSMAGRAYRARLEAS